MLVVSVIVRKDCCTLEEMLSRILYIKERNLHAALIYFNSGQLGVCILHLSYGIPISVEEGPGNRRELITQKYFGARMAQLYWVGYVVLGSFVSIFVCCLLWKINLLKYTADLVVAKTVERPLGISLL